MAAANFNTARLVDPEAQSGAIAAPSGAKASDTYFAIE
jgi:hypothetical protein